MTPGWQPDATGVAPGGDVGGDLQAGDSYSVRYRNPSLPNALVTKYAYPASGEGEGAGKFCVQVMTEYLTCDDPADPGGTETWSDYRYNTLPLDGGTRYWDTAAEAATAAREAAGIFARLSWPVAWDGQPR